MSSEVRAQKSGSEVESAGGKQHRNARSRLLISLGMMFCLLGLLWFAYWLFFLRLEESTDNAYVTGNLVRISSQVNGSVSEIYCDNTDTVIAGQTLVRLDPTDADLALQRARASLATAVREVHSLMAESVRLKTLVSLRTKELEKAAGDYQRRRERRTAMAVSEEELSHARDNHAIAETALQVAVDDLYRNQLLLLDKPLNEQPLVRQRANEMREAWLALKRCEIRSPVSGVVARRSVQAGMRVTPANPLMAVVPLDDVWIDANFKEVQLGRMRIGQNVDVTVDMYGSDTVYKGTIAGLSAGTGSSFSLLPPENATGNWIKVVQRVAVKIVLDKEKIEQFPLLIGLSCVATVDVSKMDGSILSQPLEAEHPRFHTDVLYHDPAEIDHEIEEIIQYNTHPGPQ